MSSELENDSQQKARDLARKITVAHDLDPEIQEELYGHIEDKLLAYKSGEVRISDEDAFILVREHFGDANVIRGLLQEVHGDAVQVGLARKILALIIAVGSIGVVSKFLESALSLGVFLGDIPINYMALKGIEVFFVVATLALLVYMLSRWKRGVDSGVEPWYVRWPLPRMTAWAILLFLLTLAIPNVRAYPEGAVGVPLQSFLGVAIAVAQLGILIGTCMIWLWWIGTPHQRARHILNMGVLWLGFWLLGSLSPAIAVHIGSGNPRAYGVATLAEGHIGDMAAAGYLTWGGPWESIFEFGLISGFLGAIMLVSCLAVIVWQIVLRRRSARAGHIGISV